MRKPLTAVYNLRIYLNFPLRTSKLIFDLPEWNSTCPYHIFTIIHFNNHCFVQNFNLSIRASKLKINLPGSKIYSLTSGWLLRYSLLTVTLSVVYIKGCVSRWSIQRIKAKCMYIVGLAVHHQSIWGCSFIKFLGLVKITRVIAGKTHNQSPILKTKGVLSNLAIPTCLWEQSCILHALTKTACL